MPDDATRHEPPRTIEELIDASRIVRCEATFDTFVSRLRKMLPGPSHFHEGVLTGKAVQEFQNWQLDNNRKWRLTDAQLLAVMRVEFPQATGKLFTGTLDEGLSIVKGIRAHYNRDGYYVPSPQSRGLPKSISYGQW